MNDILFMVDLDGTLIRNGQTCISKAVSSLLFPLVLQRRLVINSARHPLGVRNALKEALPFVPTIALNGGALCIEHWDKPSQVHIFKPSLVDGVITTSAKHGITLSIYTAEKWWVTRFDKTVEHEAKATGMTPEILTDVKSLNVLKMTAMGNENVLVAFGADLRGVTGISFVKSNPCYCEISPFGINKTTFLSTLLTYLGLDRDQIKLIFFGDSYNDIECASLSDFTYTFDTAPAALRKLAKKSFSVETDHELAWAIQVILNES